MALEICDGFDTYTTSQAGRRYATASSVLITNTGPLGFTSVGPYLGFGQYLVVGENLSGSELRLQVTARNTYYFGFHFITFGFTGGNGGGGISSYYLQYDWFRIYNSSGTLLLTLDGTTANNSSTQPLYISVLGGSYTSYPGVLTGNWQTLKGKIVADPTVGEILIQVDGVTIYHGTGLNTGSVGINSFRFLGPFQGGGNSVYAGFDDAWIFNTSGSHSNVIPGGDMLIRPLYPASDVLTGFTRSSGSHNFSLVDEAQADDDTSYVYNNLPSEDKYTAGSLPALIIANVHGVQTTATARKDSSTNTKTMHVTVTSGSSVSESGDFTPSTSYGASSYIVTDDPSTSAQWTTTEINNMKIGVKEIL